MSDNNPQDRLIRDLQERAKELNCLYQIEELLSQADMDLDDLFQRVVEVLPPGWQFPEICQAKIVYEGQIYQTAGFEETPWVQSATIKIQDKVAGTIFVSYTREVPKTNGEYFLKEENKLIRTIADRIGHAILHKKLKNVFQEWEQRKKEQISQKGEWSVIVNLLKNADKKLLVYISQKMLHYLAWNGVKEAKQLLQSFADRDKISPRELLDDNRPSQKHSLDNLLNLNSEIFAIAAENLRGDYILSLIEKWIKEDKSRFLVKLIGNPNSALPQIMDAIIRHRCIEAEGFAISPAVEKSLRMSLIRRFFSDQPEFVSVAKNFIDFQDYYEIIQRIICLPESRGKLGGKCSGLFLANQILSKSGKFPNLKVPKTWFITSDIFISFLHYNNLEEMFEQKYKPMEEVHLEYPNIIQILKNSYFPPDILKGLAIALEDFGNKPIIVRSSSLFEDRFGAAFSGKYKSLFLANQGDKNERLEALTDAIAEVYASVFAPDPIEYRRERNLLDCHEEMGIMIQEVVGTQIDYYFLPTFAGVAFSSNEFRWSPRIKREDGLLRIVPGLGTRAVDRVGSDYPVLVAPGNPQLRVNVAPEEIMRYSPKKADVINLRTNTLETIEIAELLRNNGNDIPGVHNMVSVYEHNYLQVPSSLLNMDFDTDNLVVTFEGTITRTPFVKQMQQMLIMLQQKFATPIDLEFAYDGHDLYLLQCRPQSHGHDLAPSPIPKDIPEKDIVFAANKYVSNGSVPDITHVVYIDPQAYNHLPDFYQLQSVGKAVSKLNQLLPKKQFILIGPGRWGTRDDIRLGVNVTYSDINKTALLVEIAQKKGNYLPELSFGTHFFQDLVESSIRYLPLYPDNEGTTFNQLFFSSAANIFAQILPEFSSLADTIKVIDIPSSTDGMILRILMNADLEEAVGFLTQSRAKNGLLTQPKTTHNHYSDDFWLWRKHMAEKIAAHLDPQRFAVKGFYLFGSTKNATAGPASDIDILIHFQGTEEQKQQLLLWLEGWSRTLAEVNYLNSGYKTDELLDVHIVTDEDIANRTSYAIKIGAITDAAKPLPLGSPSV